MRAEYSGMNNSKMLEHALSSLPNPGLLAARETDFDDELANFSHNENVICLNIEFNFMSLMFANHSLNQVSDLRYMECSRLSDGGGGVDEGGEYYLKNGININPIRMTYQGRKFES